MSDATFDEIYAGLKPGLEQTLSGRSKASRTGMIRLAIGLVLTAVLCLVFRSWWIFIAVIGVVATLSFAFAPGRKLAQQIKVPVLTAVAERLGLAYQASGFQPPGPDGAFNVLFGRGDSYTYANLFSGAREGRSFAFYEADITETSSDGENDSTTTLFQGLIYAFQRRSPAAGLLIVRPHRMLKFGKPSKTVQPVAIDDDPEFAKAFDVYAGDEAEARAVLTPELRKQMLAWRGKGKLYLQIAGDQALLAMTSIPCFEPKISKKVSSEESARKLYQSVKVCLGRFDEIDRAFG